MKHILCGLILLSTFAIGQAGQPPQTTPPTFPENRPSSPQQTPPDTQAPPQQMPPDTQAPTSQQMSSDQIQAQIEQQLASEPELAQANIRAKVDEDSVLLIGTANSERQHELAVHIAQDYSGGRKVVDHISVKQGTQ